MRRGSAALLAIVALCFGLVLTSVLAEKKKGPSLKDGEVLSDEQAEHLPDNSDPAQKKVLKCGICKAAVLSMLYGILKKENEENRKLKEVEIVEILESVCSKDMQGYGLTLDSEANPTQQWSNDANELKAKGGWITRLAENTCSDVYNEYEEYLIEDGPKTCKIQGDKKVCSTEPVVRHVCVGLGVCGEEEEEL